MPDNQEFTTNRERYMERLKAKYPDREYADDEAVFGQINDDYDEYDSQLEVYRENDNALSELLNSDPRSASFLVEWRQGGDPVMALVKRFGDNFKEALEDPEKREALAEANKEYAERLAQEKKYEEEYQKNIKETLAIINSLQEEDGWTDEDVDSAMDFLIGIMRDAVLGKFTRESIEMAMKAIRHDDDVEIADREGEVRGRNSRIEERLRKRSHGDGTANIRGRNADGGSARDMPDFGALDNNYGSANIFERGGEKRIKYR